VESLVWHLTLFGLCWLLLLSAGVVYRYTPRLNRARRQLWRPAPWRWPHLTRWLR
jgi:hypothetical protein